MQYITFKTLSDILVNDIIHYVFDIPSTIKDYEHDHRAAKHSHSHNIFPTSDSKFPEKLNLLVFLSTK